MQKVKKELSEQELERINDELASIGRGLQRNAKPRTAKPRQQSSKSAPTISRDHPLLLAVREKYQLMHRNGLV
jgi:hypothetical protein